jgi:Peptidase family M13
MNIRPEVARLVVTANPHSLPIFRIDNAVSNMPEFAQAFGCKAGQKMVRANACRVWWGEGSMAGGWTWSPASLGNCGNGLGLGQ